MKKPLFLSALCVILILCLNSICYSQYIIKKISKNPYDDTNPQINNNGYVVWQGYDGTDWEIFLYDGTKAIQLTDNSYDDINPQINDNGYVVWQDRYFGGSDSKIYLYDGSNTIQLTDNAVADVGPQISNNGHVVWIGVPCRYCAHIFLYDGITITQLSDDLETWNHRPRINDNGDVVWFVDECGMRPGIYLYNGSEVIPLATKSRDLESRNPEINNNGQVVWYRYVGENLNHEIMLFNGTKIVQLTNNPLYLNYDPKINNKGEIAWTRGTMQGTSVIVYNGRTFTEFTISSRASGRLQIGSPQINDPGFVVFQSFPDSNSDIYLASRVSVISPDGGEPVPSGLPYTIRWAGPAQAVKYKVKYSMDNGLTWNKAHQEPFVTGTTLNWNVPVPPSNKRKCLVEVVGFNASDEAVSRDRSDKPFTIEVLRLTSPNAGEPPITAGGQHTITWITNTTVEPVDHIVLSYTLNNGLTWKKIDTTADSADDGSFIWNVPDVAKQKNNCKVKIVLKDAFRNTVGSDVSDGVFTIQPAPLP